MNAHQREAMDRVHNILTEHFDAFIYVVNDEDESVGGYGGGFPAALGLCEMQKARMIKSHLKAIDEEQ